MINLVLIDDHLLLRQGIIKLLKNIGNYTILREFQSGEELISEFNTVKDKTDLFILDYSLPGKNGVETLRELQSTIIDEKFLILTQNDSLEIKTMFYKLGARGFISKTCSGDELKDAIAQIVDVGYYKMQENIEILRNNFSNLDPVSIISIREMEFIKWVCCDEELTYIEIAQKMHVSVKTIDYYRTNLFEKFNIKSKVGLILFSFKNKLTAPFI